MKLEDLFTASEYDEQKTVIEYCDNILHLPIYHIPNEGKRSTIAGAQLLAIGLRPGFPDLCLPVAKGKYHSLYIEMKAKNGKVSKDQKYWLNILRAQGHATAVCFGADEAIKLINNYLKLKEADNG